MQNNSSRGLSFYIYEWFEAILTAVVAISIIFAFGFRIISVSGQSMENTLKDEDKVLITNFNYQPKDGDIVVITHAKNFSENIIKRVIATQGQSLNIDFSTGQVTVDGKVLNEPYIKNSTITNEGGEIPSVVPQGYIFVMGDNRQNSKDSRSSEIGLIENGSVLGKARAIIYPISRFTTLYK